MPVGVRRRALLVIAIAALAIAACQPAATDRGAGGAGGGDRVLQFTATEFAFQPNAPSARAGELTFVVRNAGRIEHNFVLQNAAGETVANIPIIAAGGTERVSANLQPGRYRIVCSLPGHPEAGMVGTLEIR